MNIQSMLKMYPDVAAQIMDNSDLTTIEVIFNYIDLNEEIKFGIYIPPQYNLGQVASLLVEGGGLTSDLSEALLDAGIIKFLLPLNIIPKTREGLIERSAFRHGQYVRCLYAPPGYIFTDGV